MFVTDCVRSEVAMTVLLQIAVSDCESLRILRLVGGSPDAVSLAERLLAHKVTMALGHVFKLDPSQKAPWSRCNVCATLAPALSCSIGQCRRYANRFYTALRNSFVEVQKREVAPVESRLH